MSKNLKSILEFNLKKYFVFPLRWRTRRSGRACQSRELRATPSRTSQRLHRPRRPRPPEVDVASAGDGGGAGAGHAAAPEPERAGQSAGGPAPRAAVDAAGAAAAGAVVDAERQQGGAHLPAAAAGQQPHLRHAQHGAQGVVPVLAQAGAFLGALLLPHQEGARTHQSALAH